MLKEKIEGFDPSLPLEKASSLPSEWYVDDDVFQAERKFVFAKNWQAVGRTDQLTKPGSFFTATVAGEPVVVTKDKDGKLHAFSNVCRHRAARVVTAAEGCSSFFQCRYHGWTYDLTGKLKGTPEFDGVEDFSKEENPLPSWLVDSWGPIVFVNASTQAKPLDEFLDPLPTQMKLMNVNELKFVKRQTYDIECNWKVFVDNYLDGGYHINTIHPALAGVLDQRNYKTVVHPFTSMQSSPLGESDVKLGDITVSNVRAGDFAYYWWIYPNLMINLYEGVMDTNLVIPLGPNRCRVIFDYYFNRTEGELQQRYIDDSTAIAHQVQLEDLEICEDVQRGLASLSYDTGRFSVKREKAGYHFHQLLGRELQSAG